MTGQINKTKTLEKHTRIDASGELGYNVAVSPSHVSVHMDGRGIWVSFVMRL